MFHELVSRNDDIRRLVEKGYALLFDDGYLIVRDIPYLDNTQTLQIGAIVAKLTFVDDTKIAAPDDHQVFFCGSHPHGLTGSPIPNLGGGGVQLALKNTSYVVQRTFSNKASTPFTNFFDKIESYVTIISGPAMERHGASPYTFGVDKSIVAGSVFKFHDTLTSRAEIGDLARKFNDDVVVIIGLGGTGSYVLDLIAKTPVKEIRAYDMDAFHVHNSFRAPGRLTDDELGKKKTDVYESRYNNFRSGLSFQARFIDATCSAEVEGATFAFVCVDKGSSRAGIFDLLISKGIPFVDVGLGLNRKRGPLNGTVRTTYYSPEKATQVLAKGLAEMVDDADDLYRNHVQIAELNALNACLAVMKFKQLRGFYVDDNSFYQILLAVEDFSVVGDAFE